MGRRALGSKAGLRREDYHTGEPISDSQRARTERIERRYLPLCAHVTAASSGIAAALADKYSISKPRVIYNTFPWSERAGLDGSRLDRTGPEVSLYWYSQWVGLDRGLQDAIRAIGLLTGRVQLHIRGSLSGNVRDELLRLAREWDAEGHVYFHPQVAPGDLLSRAAEHDVGLALEQAACLSKSIATSNKLFLYMLAGLALSATDVPGQRDVLQFCRAAGFLYEPGDYRSLARHLDRWYRYPHELVAAKAAALNAARERWNWEVESQKLVAAVETVLGQAREPR